MKRFALILILTVTLLTACDSKNLESNTHNSSDIISNNTDLSVESITKIEETSPLPKIKKSEPLCSYGTANQFKKMVYVNGKTIDFTNLVDKTPNLSVDYCIMTDLSAIYYSYIGQDEEMGFNYLIQSDIDFKNSKVILKMEEKPENIDNLHSINELVAVDKSPVFFFKGTINKGYDTSENCYGSINVETGETNYEIIKNQVLSVSYNGGVMVYGGSENPQIAGEVMFFENGEIRKIKLTNSAETEAFVYISSSGKYLCSLMIGETQNNELIERYSVYDAVSGGFMQSYDHIFEDLKLGDVGFSTPVIDEEGKMLYFTNARTGVKHQFDFS